MLRKLCNLTATCLAISLIFLSYNSLAQTLATDHFRSKGNGSWHFSTTWESSHDNVNWINATVSPDTTSSSVTIRNGNIVTISSSVKIDQLSIASGGKLVATTNFTLFNGYGIDLEVYGVLELSSNMTATNAQIVVKNGGIYQKNLTGNGSLNSCTWEDGSTLKLFVSPSNQTYSLTNTGQSFYHVIFECSNSTSNSTINLDINPQAIIRGDLNLVSTNTNFFVLSTTPQIVSLCQVNGNIILNGRSVLTLSSTVGNTILNVNGNIQINNTANLVLGNNPNNVLNLYGDIIGLLGNINTGIQANSTTNKDGNLKFCNTLTSQYFNVNKVEEVNYVLEPGSSVTFNTLTLSTGFTLTIENEASLIITSPSTTQATIKRNIPPADWSNPLDGWHLISSPVQAQALNTGGFLSEPYDFYAWGETQNQWLNQKDITNGIAAFVPGKGYFVSYNEGGTKTFSGALNALNVTFNNLTITGSSPYTGFHLMGNPFPCSIDWNATGWTKTGIGTIAQIWSDEAGNFLPLTVANGIIPPEQGFFIQAVNSSNSFTIPLSARTHGNSTLNKETPVNFLQLRVTDTVTGKYDETVIILSQDALPGFDHNDGHKLTGSEAAPSLFTVVSTEEQLCVNTLPGTFTDVIPLYFKPGTGNHYKLEAVINTLEGDTWLEDKKTGLTINLKENPLLWVSASESDPLQRFVIHPGTLGKNEQPKTESLIYSYGKTIYFRNVTANSQYKLCTISGDLISSGAVSPGVVSSLNLPHLSPGFYLISILSGSSVQTQKIFIQ